MRKDQWPTREPLRAYGTNSFFCLALTGPRSRQGNERLYLSWQSQGHDQNGKLSGFCAEFHNVRRSRHG